MSTNPYASEIVLPASHFDFTGGKRPSEKAPEFDGEALGLKFHLDSDGVIADSEVASFVINHFDYVSENLVRIIPQGRLNDFFLSARDKIKFSLCLEMFFQSPAGRMITLDRALVEHLEEYLGEKIASANPNHLVEILQTNLGFEHDLALTKVANHLDSAILDFKLTKEQFNFIIEHKGRFNINRIAPLIIRGVNELCTRSSVSDTLEDNAFYTALTDFIIDYGIEKDSELGESIRNAIVSSFTKKCAAREENVPLSIANIIGISKFANGLQWSLSYTFNTTSTEDLLLRLQYLDKIGFGEVLRGVYDEIVISKIGTPEFNDTAIAQAIAINHEEVIGQLFDGIRTNLDDPAFAKFAIGMTIVHDFSDGDKHELTKLITSDTNVEPANYIRVGKAFINAIGNARQHGFELPDDAYNLIRSKYSNILPFEMLSIARNKDEVAEILNTVIERVQSQHPEKTVGELLTLTGDGADNLRGLVSAANKTIKALESKETLAVAEAMTLA